MTHPEAQPGEVCIGNLFAVDVKLVGWRTKRVGIIPRGPDGNPINGGSFRPVFVQRAEIEAAGVVIPETGVVDHGWGR